MINIVMISRNRDILTKQAISSLCINTDVDWRLVIVDDASSNPIAEWLHPRRSDRIAILRNETSKGIVGQVRNLGVYWAEKYWGRGDWLVTVDNDVWFDQGWASKMIQVFNACPAPLRVLGGYRHPYHGVNRDWHRNNSIMFVQETDAVAGYMHMMKWETWDKYGPLDAHAVGVGQSEDYKFCRDCVNDGGVVGYITPPVIQVCGMTDTLGKTVVGAGQFSRLGGVHYE